jgi:hypothetical protein
LRRAAPRFHPVLASAVSGADQRAAGARRDYALVIGVDNYKHFPPLNNPVQDATQLAAELKTVFGFETTLLTDPTEAQILEAMKTFALRTYDPEDQVFIFYGGHGELDEVDEGYISGVDSVPHGKGGRSALSHAYVQRIVTKIAARHVFLVLDSCFSGTFDPRVATAGVRAAQDQITAAELLARNLSLNARLWLTSGRNDVVSDGVAGQGSPFARMLLDTLRSYGGESGIVTTANIFSAAQVLKTQPAWGELPNHSPGGQFVFAVGGGGNVVRPRPLSALERERPLIQSALDSFAAAYKQRNVQALALVYPTLPEAERRALQRAFASDCREYSVTLATPEMFLTNGEGTAAQVIADATYTCAPANGQRPQAAHTRDVFQMRKQGDTWVIAGATSTNKQR